MARNMKVINQDYYAMINQDYYAMIVIVETSLIIQSKYNNY